VASLALDDVDPDLLEKLAFRAKRLGTTVESEALRALREHLARHEPSSPTTTPSSGPASAAPGDASSAPQALPEDPRFVRKRGMWVFSGKVDPRLIPDHRELREERIDSFVKGALGESSD